MPNTPLLLNSRLCIVMLLLIVLAPCRNAVRVKMTAVDHLVSRRHVGHNLGSLIPPGVTAWKSSNLRPEKRVAPSRISRPRVSLKPQMVQVQEDARIENAWELGKSKNIIITKPVTDLFAQWQTQEDVPTSVQFPGKAMKRLGQGKFGEVWEATDLETGAQSIVKFFLDASTGEYLTWNKAGKIEKWLLLKGIEECKLVQKIVSAGKHSYPSGASHVCECKGEHIVPGIADPNKVMYTVWEVAGRETLSTIKLPESLQDRIRVARTIMKQVAEVLVLLSMFDPPIIHHDLKPDNIMVKGDLNEGFDVKLIDFGCFVPASEEMKTSITMGDAKYVPPEYAWENAYSDPPSSFDMWSFGLIYMQLLCPEYTHEHWFPSDRSAPTAASVMQGFHILLRELADYGSMQLIAKDLELIESCLHINPSERPNPSTMVDTLIELLHDTGSPLDHEQTRFKKGDFVQMLVSKQWVQCVVTEAAAEYYDIRVCDQTGCVIHPDVEPARVKGLGDAIPSDVKSTRPGNDVFADFE